MSPVAGLAVLISTLSHLSPRVAIQTPVSVYCLAKPEKVHYHGADIGNVTPSGSRSGCSYDSRIENTGECHDANTIVTRRPSIIPKYD